MKKISYLLVWLLSGFSIAANQNSQRNTMLISQVQTAKVWEAETPEPEICGYFLRKESIRSAQNEKRTAGSVIHLKSFISSTKR